MELIEEIAQLWTGETGLPLPYPRTTERWISESDADEIFGAIRKTGRKVGSVAGTPNAFSPGAAVAYCSNILRSSSARRSAVVEAVR
jgi:hypothetical protein